ncbi:hypothetical protein PRIPAC_71303, partial [Pristionchus pacificus]
SDGRVMGLLLSCWSKFSLCSKANDEDENSFMSVETAVLIAANDEGDVVIDVNSVEEPTRYTCGFCATTCETDSGLCKNCAAICMDDQDCTDDSSTKKGVMFDKLFDQIVELSLGSGKKLVESEVLKATIFEDLGFPSRLFANVVSAGYSKLTPIQQYTTRSIQEGKDIIACSPTGTGKTAAFLLPIISQLLWEGDLSAVPERPCMPRALIIAPTRELATQIHRVAAKFSAGTCCKCDVIHGGTAFKFENVGKDFSILIGTTDRVKQFVYEGVISLEKIKYLVVDEVDRMIDSRLTYSKDLELIMEKGRITSTEERQTLLFSATLPSWVKERVKSMKLMKEDHLMVIVDKIGAANNCIVQDFLHVRRYEKKMTLLETMGADLEKYERSRDSNGLFKQKTLIYVANRRIADVLVAFLADYGIPTGTTTHGNREDVNGESGLDSFRIGRTPFLIATSVVERGLDIAGVDHVINYDMPKGINEYVYRIGRSGRIGNAGRSTSFIEPGLDRAMIRPLINLLTEAEQIVPDWLEYVEEIVSRGSA